MKTGSITNELMIRHPLATVLPPKIGTGVTMVHWTDRTAGTITWMSDNLKTIIVTEDDAERIDKNGMSENQVYSYTTNYKNSQTTYTLRKNGKYYRKGDTIKSIPLVIGTRDKYYDYSF